MRATAFTPRRIGGRGEPVESEAAARRRGLEDGTSRIWILASKSVQEGDGAVLFIGPDCERDLLAIRPETPEPGTPVFGLSESQIGRRVKEAAKAAGLGEGFTGHFGRIGIARDLGAAGVELPALMTAGR